MIKKCFVVKKVSNGYYTATSHDYYIAVDKSFNFDDYPKVSPERAGRLTTLKLSFSSLDYSFWKVKGNVVSITGYVRVFWLNPGGSAKIALCADITSKNRDMCAYLNGDKSRLASKIVKFCKVWVSYLIVTQNSVNSGQLALSSTDLTELELQEF